MIPGDEPVAVCSCGSWLTAAPHPPGCPAAPIHTSDEQCLPHLESQVCPACQGEMWPKSAQPFGVWYECVSCNFGGCHGDDMPLDCAVCGVTWGDPCPECHRRGFHRADCSENGAVWGIDTAVTLLQY